MDNQTVIIIVSVISFIIIVIFSVKIFLEYNKFKKLSDNTIFPPWPAQCPDYWKTLDNNVCHNINKIGICRANDGEDTMDFDAPPFKGGKGDFYKCNWSKKCEAPWEGIDSIC
jgi:hypothetical protein